jgi:hypothetical protein
VVSPLTVIIIVALGGLLVGASLYGWYLDSTEKMVEKDKALQRTLAMAKKGTAESNFVKIGSMPTEFNPTMHDCKIDSLGFNGYEIGDVVSCKHPDCGKEYILGWFLSSRIYGRNVDDLGTLRDKKKWLTMEVYSKNPGEYVYSK